MLLLTKSRQWPGILDSARTLPSDFAKSTFSSIKMDRKHFAKNRGQNAPSLWTPKKLPPRLPTTLKGNLSCLWRSCSSGPWHQIGQIKSFYQLYIYKLYIVTLQKNRKGTFHCVDAGIGFYFSIFFWGSLYHAISILWFSKYRYSRFPTGSYFIIWIICYRAIFKHHLSATKTQAIPGQANLWASGCSYKRPKEDDRDAAGRWWIKWSEDQPRSDVTDSKRSTVVKPTKKDVTSRTTQEDFILSLW